MPKHILKELTHTANIALSLDAEKRATYHSDATTLESVAAHSLMLAMVSMYLGADESLVSGIELKPERLLRYAIVHDILEAYTGDFPTLIPLTDEEKTEREFLEREAFAKLAAHNSTLAAILAEYQAQEEPEARWIRYLDKILPKVTQSLSGHRGAHDVGLSVDELRDLHRAQGADLRELYPEFKLLAALFDEACEAAQKAFEECIND